jgi:fatty acid desaturase
MDHKQVLATLSPARRKALTEPSDRAGLLHLAGHAGAILALAALIALRVPFWPLLLPLQGLFITFLFTLQHECTHRTPFASGWLNEAVGRLSGLLIAKPFVWFRAFHLAHHRFTNLAGQDPELASPKPETIVAFLWHLSGLPYWAGQARRLLRLAFGGPQDDFLPARQRRPATSEARVMLGLYAVAGLSLAASPILLWAWIVPVLLGQPLLRLYLLAEHGDCPQVADMLQNTRTTFTTAFVRFLAWNMPYHVEHHSYPAVPFHRLPELHRLMRDHLKVTADGYAAFTRDYLKRRAG